MADPPSRLHLQWRGGLGPNFEADLDHGLLVVKSRPLVSSSIRPSAQDRDELLDEVEVRSWERTRTAIAMPGARAIRAVSLPVAILASALLLLIPAVAASAPPERATIRVGVGMAGAKLHDRATVVERNNGTQILRSHGTTAWGRVTGFCFEGSACGWRVPHGGNVTINLTRQARGKIGSIATTSRHWEAKGGIGVGTRARRVRGRFDAVRSGTICLGLGTPYRGLVLKRDGTFTVFATKRGRVKAIAIAMSANRSSCRSRRAKWRL